MISTFENSKSIYRKIVVEILLICLNCPNFICPAAALLRANFVFSP